MLAIIGGTGLSRLAELENFNADSHESVQTPFADAPVNVECYSVHDKPLYFLPRHGAEHSIPPHQINYRANIWALSKLGVKGIVAINAVGGIHDEMAPGAFMIPDQLIDYTHGRAATFFEQDSSAQSESTQTEATLAQVTHIDFTEPFDARVRQLISNAANSVNSRLTEARVVLEEGVYAVTQGPRLETAAEIRKLRQEGCDIVGMTAMPEAALARELELPYASLALSVNWAAGLVPGSITLDEIRQVVTDGMHFVGAVIAECVQATDE